MSLIRTPREEGHYTLKRVRELPKRGNANLLYAFIGPVIDKLYRWLPNGEYEEILIGGSGTGGFQPTSLSFNSVTSNLEATFADGSIRTVNLPIVGQPGDVTFNSVSGDLDISFSNGSTDSVNLYGNTTSLNFNNTTRDLSAVFLNGVTSTVNIPTPDYTFMAIAGTNQVTLLRDGVSVSTLDLSPYLDDTNLARLVNGTLNPTTGIATFSRDDNTTFTVDFSALLGGGTSNVYDISRGGTPSSSNNQFTLSLIENSTNKTDLTLTQPTGLEAIDEGNGIGWRLIGQPNVLRPNGIGRFAVDLNVDFRTVAFDQGAEGENSFSSGRSYSSGVLSFSSNQARAQGQRSFAANASTASGLDSFSANFQNLSSGTGSASFGFSNISSGEYSFSGNNDNLSSGENSMSFNTGNISSGHSTSSLGFRNISSNWAETSIGVYNTEATNPVPDIILNGGINHRLFVIGDGRFNTLSSPVRRDIFSVYGNQGIVVHPKPVSGTSHPNQQAGMIRTSGNGATFVMEIHDGVQWRTVTLT